MGHCPRTQEEGDRQCNKEAAWKGCPFNPPWPFKRPGCGTGKETGGINAVASGQRSVVNKKTSSFIPHPLSLSKVFYSDPGSTSVEIALKIAFQYWQNKGVKDKTRFLTFKNAYHGDTIGSVSLGGMELFHDLYRPLLFKTIQVNSPYCYRCHLGKEYPSCKTACLKEVEDTIKKKHSEVAALVIEPLVQGAAGMLVQPAGFLKGLRLLCDKYKILMIADEVATGFGRTGKMFACEHEGVVPDILCIAKGITGGYLPLAATLTTD